jgi:transposase-like protein
MAVLVVTGIHLEGKRNILAVEPMCSSQPKL